MPSTADWIRQLNRNVLNGLDAKEAQIVAREAEARRMLDACEAERTVIKSQRDSVLQAERLQLDALQQADSQDRLDYGPQLPRLRSEEVLPPEGEAGHARKKRARIGTQRYFMLVSLREGGDLSLDKIEEWTGLPAKRIKDQVKLDVKEGFVEEVEGDNENSLMYSLSTEGFDLLERFEDYKRRKGERLPTLADIRDDALDEESVEEAAGHSYGRVEPENDTPSSLSKFPVFN